MTKIYLQPLENGPDNLLPQTMGHFWQDLTNKFGDRVVMIHNDVPITYLEIETRANNLARGLLELGATKGTRIGLLMENCHEWPIVFLATQKIGAICVFLSTFYAAPEIAYGLKHGDIAILISSDKYLRQDFSARIASAIDGIENHDGAKPIYNVNFPFLRHIIIRGNETPNWARANLDKLEDIGGQSSTYSAELLKAIESNISPADDSLIMYTSGSTAAPKGVIHSQGNASHKPRYMAHINTIIPSYTFQEDIVMNNKPYFWVGGYLTLFGCAYIGAISVSCDDRGPEKALEQVRKHKITQIIDTEGFIKSLIAVDGFKEEDLANFKPQPSSQLGYWRELEGIDRALNANPLGMTETFGPHSGVVNGAIQDMNHAFTLGPALPYMEFRIRDIETGEILPPENEGELFVRGRWLMNSFYKRERHEIFDADGYYGTGDKVFLGHDGHIYFKGRIGGMIKTSGANVSPEEVEIAIRLLPDVVDAAVFGIPDPKLEQKVVAVIVLRNNAKIDETKIIEFLKGQLSSFKVPKLVLFKSLEELPLTPSNKIRKPILMKSICDELGIKI